MMPTVNNSMPGPLLSDKVVFTLSAMMHIEGEAHRFMLTATLQ
jgi:hypothetical protein